MPRLISPVDLGIAAAESGVLPDAVLRLAIRRLCTQRLRECAARFAPLDGVAPFLPQLKTGPIALVPQKANEQHYELPPEFFKLVLGPRRKYSCCLFHDADATLEEAEYAALEATCAHAQLADGQRILELGCGWGSLTLWMAQHYPASQILAVSNSLPQRTFIEAEASRRGLKNLRIVTADMNDFDPANYHEGRQPFDRVVSIEMFEHMRNYDRLLERVASWLAPTGRFFAHVFCHKDFLYPFNEENNTDWMARHFFSGGLMPSADLFHQFPNRFQVESQWIWSGRHYQQTADAWLANLDRNRDDIESILAAVYGERDAMRWKQRWRMFFLAVSELFGYGGGDEWFVTHCRMRPVR
jgi:cyclopropane-fatty-acyl-phospholipid synthase